MAEDGVDMEPFSLLAHDIRLDIVEALFEQLHREEPDQQTAIDQRRGVRYSTLMDAVGLEDSGKFNYHLDQLRGVYVDLVLRRSF